MKKIIFTVMVCFAPSVFAQNAETTEKKNWGKPFELTLNFDGGQGTHDHQLYHSKIHFMYAPISRLGIAAEVGHSLALNKADGVKTWERAYTVGGGLKFKFGMYQFPDKDNNVRLYLKASMGSTIGRTSWNYTYYDAGVQLLIPKSVASYGLSIGYRHYNSHNDMIPNFNGLYVGILF